VSEWKPWEVFVERAVRLPLDGPPCKDCSRWNPHALFDCNGNADGVRCCSAVDMENDFSCFRQIPKKAEKS